MDSFGRGQTALKLRLLSRFSLCLLLLRRCSSLVELYIFRGGPAQHVSHDAEQQAAEWTRLSWQLSNSVSTNTIIVMYQHND